MICPTCHGGGRRIAKAIVDPDGRIAIEPCPECNGCGVVSCCDAAGSVVVCEPITNPAPESGAGNGAGNA
jgi:DnaJ-class molecular chaperone